MSLALIFGGAGGRAAGKVGLWGTISKDIEELYNSAAAAALPPGKKREIINIQDLGSWCGVFTMFVSRLAGMKYGGWPYKVYDGSKNPKIPRELCDVESFDITGNVKPGDIGIFDYLGTNHHFLVVETEGGEVLSIDGNVGDPDINTRFPWSSVVAPRRYRRMGKTSLMPVGGPVGANDKCYFMRPIWENLSKR